MNLETIAKLAGVSRSTVSRVINNSPNVSDEVRDRVQIVLTQTNFQPNIAARSLAAGHTQVIGLVIPATISRLFSDPFFPLLIQGVSSACNSRDHSVMLWLAEPEYERRMIRQILYNGIIDGVIISSAIINDPLVDALQERNIPFVMVGEPRAAQHINFIDVDNDAGAQRAVLHLARLGYKRIATITCALNTEVGLARLAGYRQALYLSGLQEESTLIYEGDFSTESGYQGAKRLLPIKPDAIFVASDPMTQGTYRALAESGVRIPEDIAIVGFDDLPFSAHLTPPLTTVRQPVINMGSVAVETLIDAIEHPERPVRHVRLPTELVIRSSCGLSLHSQIR
jgi:LacI family transcriptional regulator